MSCTTLGMFQMENLSALPPEMGMGKLSRLKTQALIHGPESYFVMQLILLHRHF